LPREVSCPETHIIDTIEGTFIPLETLLSALYVGNESSRPIRKLLSELTEMVPLDGAVRTDAPDHGLLVTAAEQEGFHIVKGVRQGKEILLSIGWRASKPTSLFHVANCRFLVEQGKPAAGHWVQLQGEAGVAGLLFEELNRSFPGGPDCLLTRSGLDYIASLPNQA
jgi:hypothetical protein